MGGMDGYNSLRSSKSTFGDNKRGNLTRAMESESRKKSKNRKKSDKIGKIRSDFLSDFLAKLS